MSGKSYKRYQIPISCTGEIISSDIVDNIVGMLLSNNELDISFALNLVPKLNIDDKSHQYIINKLLKTSDWSMMQDYEKFYLERYVNYR